MAQPTRPGNTERGWNDPPMLLHGNSLAAPPTNQGQSFQKRTLLNKRVAHPGIFSSGGTGGCPTSGTVQSGVIDQQTVPSCTSSSPTLASSVSQTTTNIKDPILPAQAVPGSSPPPPTSAPINGVILLPPAASTDIPKFTAPIIVPTMSPKEDSPLAQGAVATNPVTNQPVNTEPVSNDTPIPDFDNDEQMYHFVLTRLKKTCLSCAETVQPKIIDDINRKLEIFSNMWKDGKISYEVKSSMARLATALHHRKCDLAHQIHLALMMDYVSEVGQWMVGIKRLIQEARATDAPLSPTDNTVSGLFNAGTKATEDSLRQHGIPQSASDCNSETQQMLLNDTQVQEQVQLADSMAACDTEKTESHRQSDSPATIEATMIE